MNLFQQFLHTQMMTSALSAGLRRWRNLAGKSPVLLFAVSEKGSCILAEEDIIPAARLRRLAEQVLQLADTQDQNERAARADT